MKASEFGSKKNRRQGEFSRGDARPSEVSVDNARNRTAIIISGRLPDHETGRNTWEHGVLSMKKPQPRKEAP